MLNSAAGFTLPGPIEPPITTRRSTLDASSGRTAKSNAMLVSGPVATRVTVSRCRISVSRSMALGCGALAGGGSRIPPSPVSPWTCSAYRSCGCTNDRPAPAATGMSRRPASSSTWSALRVVVSRPALPPTVVTARSSYPGVAHATRIATMSSIPGSQSRTSTRVTLTSLGWRHADRDAHQLQRRLRRDGRGAGRLRGGWARHRVGRRGLQLRRGEPARVHRRADEPADHRVGHLPAVHADADAHRDDGRRARLRLRWPVLARPGCLGSPGDRGVPRGALRRAARPYAGNSGDLPDGVAPRTGRLPGSALPDPAARRAGHRARQAVEAD